VPRPSRRPPAITLDDSSEDEEESEEDDGHQDNDVDEDPGDENEDLQGLDSASLKQKMTSEVCNLLKFDLILSYI
jgi:hypothetical protein